MAALRACPVVYEYAGRAVRIKPLPLPYPDPDNEGLEIQTW